MAQYPILINTHNHFTHYNMPSARKFTNASVAIQLIDILTSRLVFKNQINGHLEDELDLLRQEFIYYTERSFFLPPRASRQFNKLLKFISKSSLKNSTIRKHLITIRNIIINFWSKKQINRYKRNKHPKTKFLKSDRR